MDFFVASTIVLGVGGSWTARWRSLWKRAISTINEKAMAGGRKDERMAGTAKSPNYFNGNHYPVQAR